VQRRHQKLLEESPSPFLSDEARAQLYDAALGAVRSTRYRNAGTIECLLGADQSFYFMEMNTRLQVEHPVSEEVTGIDLVRAQLRLAMGEPLPQEGIAPTHGHAIEFRINAEDPARGFMPSPGALRRFRPPLGRGVRVDTHAYEGYTVPPNYDSLLAKLIVSDDDRPSALARAAQALMEFEVEGVATTLPLFREMVTSEPVFRSGVYTTAYLDEVPGRLSSLSA
jgi:acetyl-CoA carboxylase biotin carboxylase subunit